MGGYPSTTITLINKTVKETVNPQINQRQKAILLTACASDKGPEEFKIIEHSGVRGVPHPVGRVEPLSDLRHGAAPLTNGCYAPKKYRQERTMKLCAVHIAPGWQTRPFTEADIPAILKLCRGNPAYYRHMGMEPTAGNLRDTNMWSKNHCSGEDVGAEKPLIMRNPIASAGIQVFRYRAGFCFARRRNYDTGRRGRRNGIYYQRY